jgi:hypothetical protein
VVAGLLGALQDLLNIYDGFLKQILDPKNPVVHDVDPPVPSPLLPAQVSAWDNCGGGVVRDDFNGASRRTGYLCDSLLGQVRELADETAPIRPNKVRPGTAEGIRLPTGEVVKHTSIRGKDLPEVHPAVQFLLVLVPLTARGDGHGHCGLVFCLTNALNEGLDPTGSEVAAFNVRNDVAHGKHNQPMGPCNSCSILAGYYDLKYLTDGLEWWTP